MGTQDSNYPQNLPEIAAFDNVTVQKTVQDADLGRIIAAWPTLPHTIRRTMLELID
ncbi:MAG TPA: hypothetical protein VHZ24_15180 [Pirellulales bacterium]|jgi:hypothetical protein|nr:hypothetical protein [Pirellulales bacterium]